MIRFLQAYIFQTNVLFLCPPHMVCVERNTVEDVTECWPDMQHIVMKIMAIVVSLMHIEMQQQAINMIIFQPHARMQVIIIEWTCRSIFIHYHKSSQNLDKFKVFVSHIFVFHQCDKSRLNWFWFNLFILNRTPFRLNVSCYWEHKVINWSHLKNLMKFRKYFALLPHRIKCVKGLI